MSFGWNPCYSNYAPMTDTLQLPPFTMNIPRNTLCCPDQLVCIDPCRPCSPMGYAPMVCSSTMCAPTRYVSAICAPAAYVPMASAFAVYTPVASPPVSSASAPCSPTPCSPVPYTPMVCSCGLDHSKYSTCYTSCSLPPQKYLLRVQSICDPCTKY